MATMTPQEYAESAKSTYQKLEGLRNQFRDRARKYSRLTLPYILPDDSSDTASQDLMQGYSAEGGIGVNTLANKYVNRMFPHYSYFKLNVPDEFIESSGLTKADVVRTSVALEKKSMKHLQKIGARAQFLEIKKHLIITGNYLLHKAEDEGQELVGYTIDNYVVQRDQRGKLLTCIAKDRTYLRALPEDIQALVIRELEVSEEEVYTKEVDLYTRIEYIEGEYLVVRSAESAYLNDEKRYKPEKLRWEPLVWHRYRKEPYGRGLVEDIYNAIYTHDVSSEVVLRAGAIAADIKFFATRDSGIDIDAVNAAESGTWHYGDVNKAGTLQVNKNADLQIMKYLMDDAKQLIGQVFMRLNSALREGERVTAEENRMRAIELDQMHGGIFSALANSLQYKVAVWTLDDVGADIEGTEIDVTIVTGIDALGRQAEAEQAVYLVSDLAQWQNVPEDIRDWVKFDAWVAFVSAGRNIDVSSIIRNRTEYEEYMNQKAQQQQAFRGTQGGSQEMSPEVAAQGGI
jgi:hypothetical protein